jgi:hypothetical protein
VVRLLAAARFAGDTLICGGSDPGHRNITSPLIAALDGGNGLPRLDTSRLRATWLAGCADQLSNDFAGGVRGDHLPWLAGSQTTWTWRTAA